MPVTGKNRIEVRYPKDVYRVLHGSGSARGYCLASAEKALEAIQFYERLEKAKAATTRPASTRAKHASKAAELNTAANELAADIAKVAAASKGRAKPALCVYPATGSDSTEAGTETRFKRRGTAFHEQFHAKVREIEHEYGQDYQGKCMDRKMNEILASRYGEDYAGPRKAWKVLGWGTDAASATEEILARTEEIRKSCLRGVEDCDGINRYMAGQLDLVRRAHDQHRGYGARNKFVAAGKPEGCSMQRLSAGIAKDYGAASTLVLEAARACGVKRKP